MVHPADHHLLAATMKQNEAAIRKPLVLRWIRKDGSILWTEQRNVPIYNEKGALVAIEGIAIDITHRKNTELLLQEKSEEIAVQNEELNQANLELIAAKDKAEASDHLKSAFLANMSHEIRTPMNGILGFAELLKEPNLTGQEQQAYIAIIEKSGRRMLNIINQIIDISKIEAGLMEINLKESCINEQLDYIYTFFKPETEAKKIKLTLKNSLPAKESIINTDREKVYAILTNLVKNAIKYTHQGAIELGYETVETSVGKSLRFYVTDTGIGIPKDRQEAIFERFVQADIADKMARQGAGLGLTISKAYVEMLGGRIWVESEEGKGSTFYFTLPYHTGQQLPETLNRVFQPATIGSNVPKLKILLAEDDRVSEMLIDKYIKLFGKEILKVKTGLEAVETCRNNPDIDLILMDIRMPEMGGYEATRQIRLFNKDVTIIAQTAHGLAGDRSKALDAGCNDYIAKPIIKTELLALIQKYFAK
jgi:signal transduction histidine kinase